MAWELFVGRVPFEERDAPVAVLYQHVHMPLPSVRSVAGDVDPRIEVWLGRMLAKDPADRFPSAETAWEEARGCRPRSELTAANATLNSELKTMRAEIKAFATPP